MVIVETVQGGKHEYPGANGVQFADGLLLVLEQLAVVMPIGGDPKNPGPSQARAKIHATYVPQHVVRFYQAADDDEQVTAPMIVPA